MEIRSLPSQVTLETRSGKPVLRGMASVVYNGQPGSEYQLAPKVMERFAPGAFDEWLATNPEIRCCLNHDEEKLIGVTPDTLTLWTDKNGLHYETELDDSTLCRDVQIMVSRKKLKGSSLQFVPDKMEWRKDGDNDIRYIIKAKVYHVSPVYRPAYKNADASLRAEAALRDLQECKDRELHELYEKKLNDLINSMGPKWPYKV